MQARHRAWLRRSGASDVSLDDVCGAPCPPGTAAGIADARGLAGNLPRGQFLMIPSCGHAPQMEKSWLINRLVVHFLTHPAPTPPWSR